jgi:histone deacetylase 6
MNRDYTSKMQPVRSRLVLKEELLLGHTESYISKVTHDLSLVSDKDINNALNNKFLGKKKIYNGDLYGNKYTLECALLSAGSVINLVDSILEEKIKSGIAIVRPPSHHACCGSAGGFCFFNSVAIAAIKADNLGKKVAIVDLDVHYGDGTADIIKDKPHIDYYSIHRHDNGQFYPGTGKKSSYANIHNYPLNYSNGDDTVYFNIFTQYYNCF